MILTVCSNHFSSSGESLEKRWSTINGFNRGERECSEQTLEHVSSDFKKGCIDEINKHYYE